MTLDAPMLPTVLDLAVGRVRLAVHDDLADAVERAVKAMGFVRSAAPRATLDFALARADGPLPEAPHDALLRARAHPLARTYCDAAGWRLWTPAAQTVVSEGQAAAHVADAATDAEVAWHLTAGLTLLARQVGAFGLHAACVAPPDEAAGALLVVGPSDVGKSTLAYALVREGWRFLSDDAVLLRETAPGGPVEAVAFRRRFGLDADGRFPELDAVAVPQPAEAAKRSADVAALFGAQARRRAVPRRLLLPQIKGARTSRLEAVAPAEAFGALLAQSGTSRLDDTRTAAHHALLGRLLAQAPPLRLLAGSDVVDRAAAVADLLAAATPPVSARP